MALGNGSTPKFEDEGTTTAPAAAATAEAPAAAPGTSPDVEATRAVTKAAGTAVAQPQRFGDVFKQYENVIQDIEFGTVARLVGATGIVQAKLNGKKLDLGESIEIEMVSFNDTYQVSPGDDTPKGKAAVKYSKDGKMIDGLPGVTVDAYLAKLINSDGFPKAALKKYVSLVGILNKVTDEKKDQSLVGSMVEVSLSPTAGKAFNGQRLQASIKVSRGLMKEEQIRTLKVTADKRSNAQGQDYTALDVTIAG